MQTLSTRGPRLHLRDVRQVVQAQEPPGGPPADPHWGDATAVGLTGVPGASPHHCILLVGGRSSAVLWAICVLRRNISLTLIFDQVLLYWCVAGVRCAATGAASGPPSTGT